jgi:hypothetical protein
MANKVLLKKSSVAAKVPLTTDLDYGELALNYSDGKLYYKNAANAVTPLSDASKLALAGGTMTGSTTIGTGNYISFGPNPTWASTLQVGGDGVNAITRTATIASVVTTNGNLHLDSGSDKAAYLNFYSGTAGVNFGNGALAVTATVSAAGVFNGTNVTVNGNQTLHAGNYTSYSPTLTGGSASGTWPISVSGNAATVTNFKSFGLISVAPNGANANITTAQFITHLTNLGMFNYAHAVGKCSWDYAGNNDLTDTGFGAIDLAGCVIETWINAAEKHVRVTRPTTGQGGFQVLVYNDQGSGYSPGWRAMMTNENIGSYAPTLTGTGASGTWPIAITGNAGSANSVKTSSGRTDGETYPVVWSATGATTEAYSCSAVSIQSSTGKLNATTFSGAGTGLTGTAASLNIGGTSANATMLQGSSIITYGASGTQWLNQFGVGGTGANGQSPSNPTNDWYHHLIFNHGNSSGYYVNFAACFHSDTYAFRRVVGGVDNGWRTLLHSGNYTSYSPTLTGGSASGTWGISVTGTSGSISGFNNPVTAPTASTIVYRDAAGDISAREIVLSSGLSAVTPTVLVSMYPTTNQMVRTTPAAVAAALSGQAMNIAGSAASVTGGLKTINGSSIIGSGDIAVSVSGLTINNVNTPINPTNVTQNQIGYANSLSILGQTDGGLYTAAYDSSWMHQIFGDFRSGQIAVRGKNSGTFQAWRTVLDSSNYSGYALPISGGTLTGRLTARQSGIALGTGNSAQIEINNAGSGACNISFHREGVYGAHFGLDTDNWFSTYGWSAGTGYTSMRVGALVASGNVTANSDERLKKDWAALPADFVDKLALIKIGTYTRTDSNERQVGTSAQSLQTLLPEAVIDGEYLSVAYGNAALVSAVELAKKVVEQESRIARLEALVSKLIEG